MERKHSPTWAAGAIWTLFLLPVLYVASTGPAGYAMNNGWITGATYWPVYLPLWEAAHHARSAPALQWYVDLWGGNPWRYLVQ